ncbi:DUF4892 domain-containing protein [Endozoicomonadaceae bacterium StTr2]
MIRKVRFILAGCLLITTALSGLVMAAAPVIQDYPNAEQKSLSSQEKHNYPVITSPLKKVNGRIMADQEVWQDGHLDRRWLQIPAGHDSFAAFEFYERQLYKQDIKVLFQCDRYTCGESTYWANHVFGIAALGGYDRSQSLLVAESGIGAHRRVYVLYAVQRGNRRVQVLLDQFQPQVTSPGQGSENGLSTDYVLAMIDSNGFYDISGWPEMKLDFKNSTGFHLLVDVLKRRSDQAWLLAVQPSSAFTARQDLQQQLKQGQVWGKAILDELKQKDIVIDKLQLLQTGPVLTVEKGNDTPVIRLISLDAD